MHIITGSLPREVEYRDVMVPLPHQYFPPDEKYSSYKSLYFGIGFYVLSLTGLFRVCRNGFFVGMQHRFWADK
jgi:hypothetical protein